MSLDPRLCSEPDGIYGPSPQKNSQLCATVWSTLPACSQSPSKPGPGPQVKKSTLPSHLTGSGTWEIEWLVAMLQLGTAGVHLRAGILSCSSLNIQHPSRCLAQRRVGN